ncbi:unnamed protein product [Calypogeia fissa]
MDEHHKTPKSLVVEVPRLRNDSTTSKLYTLEAIPGKGRGPVAAQDIARGTRVISEKPLFKVPNRIRVPMVLGSVDPVATFVASELSRLSRDEQRAFLSLHNNFPGTFHPFTGVVLTNGSGGIGNDDEEGGLFVEIARINHACRPNCLQSWNEITEHQNIHAVRCIRKGEEITVNYNSGRPSFDCTRARRRLVKSSFNFECICELCSLPAIEQAFSDTRRSEMERLYNVLGDVFIPDKSFEDAYTMLKLLEAEKITDVPLGELYSAAVRIVSAHGDQARAEVFGERAYEVLLTCLGDDNPIVAELKTLKATPAQHHRLFGCSARWALPVSAIPRTLQGEKFEAWLWRRDE